LSPFKFGHRYGAKPPWVRPNIKGRAGLIEENTSASHHAEGMLKKQDGWSMAKWNWTEVYTTLI